MKNNNSVSKALIKYIKEKEISISQISKDTGIWEEKVNWREC